MPLPAPSIDNRRYQDLLNEALARIPVHTPEWTNFGPADPGVTLIEVFAFLTESLLYRANQIPERNRDKFLQLLGVPLIPAESAHGFVSIDNLAGELKVKTYTAGLETRAGEIPFITKQGLDVLPLETRFYLKRPYADETGIRKQHYDMLYASLRQEQPSAELVLYETKVWQGNEASGVDVGADTVDGCVWLALLTRDKDKRPDMAALRTQVRELIAGKTLSLGISPALDENARRLQPHGSDGASTQAALVFATPRLPAGGKLPQEPQPREAEYRPLLSRSSVNVLEQPGIVELTLPTAADMELWQDLDPLEAGSGNFPPSLDDTGLAERVVTWIRISALGARAKLQWAGSNATEVLQRRRIVNEVLADGNGEPDQVRQLAHPPLLQGSVRLSVSNTAGGWDEWQPIDDLLAAAPEVAPAYQARLARTELAAAARDNSYVYHVDPESGQLSFGDGLRGCRPPLGAKLRVSYDHSDGLAGNVAQRAINTSSALDAGYFVNNPLPTWGGAAAEDVATAQKQIPRYIQHRDRLVTAADFETITKRTPGVHVGRVDVLPSFSPDLAPDAPGNAPGAVTLLLLPAYDPAHPDAPEPDRLFMDTVCRHLDARRLVTTELILRGPEYLDIWIAIGIELLADGRAGAEVREAVRVAITTFLSPLPVDGQNEQGWPLRRAVSAAELTAVASRVSGVRFVRGVRLAAMDGNESLEIPMHSLQLPRIAGLSVQVGDAPTPASLMGGKVDSGQPPDRRIVPVPVIPDRC